MTSHRRSSVKKKKDRFSDDVKNRNKETYITQKEEKFKG